MPRINKNLLPILEQRKLTKSEELLTHIGELVYCDMCHQQVLMTDNWKMTAYRDNNGNFIDKKAVCPSCQPELAINGTLLVSM